MADKPQRNSNDSRPGGNVWLVLLLVVGGVMASAFLFGNSSRRIRYPELIASAGKNSGSTELKRAVLIGDATDDLAI